MQAGQDLVMQDAPGALVDDLGLGQVLALEGHQAAGHLGAGLRVDQAFAHRLGQLDLFLGIQAASTLFTQQEGANQTALAPQWDG